MYVIKRDGTKTPIRYDKITDRNIEFAQDLNVDVTKLSKAVIAGLKEGMNTSDIDTLSAETAFYMSTYEPDFDKLAVRIAVSNLHKSTKNSFSDSVSDLFNATNQKTGKSLNIINAEFYNFVVKNKDFLDGLIHHTRDYKFTYFGFKTLCRSYLLKVGNKIIERPQYMWLRVSTSIHMSKTDEESLNKIEETYNMMSQFYFTHASPTLFNAGSNLQQLSSCFLLTADDDLRHIYTTCLRSALISKHAGGIGIDITRVRSKGSTIHTTNGTSDGIVPMIKVFNSTSQYCNQCFVPETIIYLKSGIKQIKDVQIGDEVITIDGTYKPVVNVIKNNVNKEIMSIRTTYSFEPVKVTKEHQVYVLRNQTKRLNYDNILNRLEKEYIKPEYIDAHDLNDLDLFGFPLCKLSETDDYENLGDDFFRFYGIMLGDGHICKNRLESGVTLNTQTKQQVVDFMIDYLTKRNVHYWTTEKENTFYIRWTNHKDVTGLDYKLLYNEESEKRVHSSFLNLTYSHSINLIKGLLETDGSNLKEIYYTTTSYELAHNIRYILYKLGILSSGHITDNIGETRETKEGYIITSTKIRYDIRIPKHPILEEILDIKEKGVYMKYFVHDGIMWSRIKKIDREQYEGDVYDLSILNNNNYLVGSLGIVHNSGKRKGSIAMYLEPWHADVLDFLQLRFNLPPDEIRARDIFIAMWINDLFMKRVEKDEMWSLFCPNTVPQLSETYGDEFESIYLQAESQGKYVKQIKAQEVWKAILHSQTETGLPYMCYKDSVNKKSNQKNIGIVRSSNLCVSGDTKIFVNNSNGKNYCYISDYKNQKVELCNGKEWTTVTVKQTSEASFLFRVKFSTGDYVDCTDYHKIPTLDSDGKMIFKHLKDCDIGTVLATYTRPICTHDYKQIHPEKWDYEEIKDVSILSITKLDGLHPTYCFTDEKNGTGLFNGVMLGNCTEITEVTDNHSIAVCNLSSISLPAFVNTEKRNFDYKKLGEIVEIITENLNKIIDINFYPVDEAKSNNLSYRPIGIGIQGLSDVFAMLDYYWGDEGSKKINRLVMEVIYYHALKRSCQLSKQYGPYSKFEGSPASQGILQYHMWGVIPLSSDPKCEIVLDWDSLIKDIKQYGLRNSLLIAPMPTASTAQIMGNCESHEMINSNIFSRSTLAGDFTIVNKHLYSDLTREKLWSKDIVDQILASDGSIQSISIIPKHIRDKYKTVWELSQRLAIDYAAERGPFIDQSQSLNLYLDYPTPAKLTSMHFYGWKKGLKTGSYYIHSKPARSAVKFTISNDVVKQQSSKNNKFVCVGEEGCISCSG